MSDLFISYSNDDTRFVSLLCSKLELMGIEYFRDEKINWGQAIKEAVDEHLINSVAVLVIVSPNSLKSQWVPYEIGYATALGKPILTFVTEPGMRLPSYLDRYKYVDKVEDLEKYIGSQQALSELVKTEDVSKLNFKLENLYLQWWENINRDRSPTKIQFNGLEFEVDRGVFSPAVRLTYSSYFSSTFLSNVKDKTVLDVGTGCGILAILAAKRQASRVVAIDRDRNAILNAQKNIKRHRNVKSKIELLQGDVFTPVDGRALGRFDVVIANLPIAFKSSFWASHEIDYSSKVEEFFKNLDVHLKDDGVAFMSWASFGNTGLIVEMGEKYKYSIRPNHEETFGVTWIIYEIHKRVK